MNGPTCRRSGRRLSHESAVRDRASPRLVHPGYKGSDLPGSHLLLVANGTPGRGLRVTLAVMIRTLHLEGWGRGVGRSRPRGLRLQVVELRVDGEAARRLVPADEVRAVAASLLKVAKAVEACSWPSTRRHRGARPAAGPKAPPAT